MAATCHWVDNNWELKSTLLDFVRFKAPHTGETAFGLLHSFAQEWGLEDELQNHYN